MFINKHYSFICLLMCVKSCLSDEDFYTLGTGGMPKGGFMDPVLFRSATCPNTNGKVCNGNGICGTEYNPWSAEDLINCKCYEGFTGADCSIRICPSATTWADKPFRNETAHRKFVECGGFGKCDRLTGECICREGYTGSACERMKCPLGLVTSTDGSATELPCTGHGQCTSLNQAGKFRPYNEHNRADAFDGVVRLEGKSAKYKLGRQDWDDGDRIHGCVCDEGWEGHDCSLRSCPVGDDPLTTNQTDDQQLVECACVAGTPCEGSFRLKFRGQSTRPIPFNATAEYLHYFLDKLPTITTGGLEVKNVEHPGAVLCTNQGEATRIIFRYDHGALPQLEVVDADPSLEITVAAGGNASYFYPWISSVKGSKEEIRCSGRGTCDRRNILLEGAGVCTCYEAFEASDREGRKGMVPDCGYFDSQRQGTLVTKIAENNTAYKCPVAKSLHNTEVFKRFCSNRGGNCSEATGFTCNCTAGYTGPGCEYADCPSSRSWFQEPNLETGRAHEKGFKCSNGGSCNEAIGACDCGSNFDGVACHTLPCPLNKSIECGGLGKCWTLNKLARYSLGPMGEKLNITYSIPWDAFKIRTCNCGRPFAVDSQVMTYRDLDRPALRQTVTEKTFRGPYAYQSTDGDGYDCSKAKCPTGDDVMTTGVNEVQEVRCRANGGAFKMFWRESISPDITWNMDAEGIKAVLEDMTSVSRVKIYFGANNDNGTQACGNGNHSFFVEFQTEFGELPLLRAFVKNRDNSFRLFYNGGNSVGVVEVKRVQKCTKENLECGRQGICNEDTGFCHCMPGLMSGGGTRRAGQDSYGTDALGHRGDCGFRHGDTRLFNTETRYVGVEPGGRFGMQ